jgi:uncharacterized protein
VSVISSKDAFSVKVFNSMTAIDPQQWDACAGEENPFVRHAYLSALEESGSVSEETGFKPQHLTIFDSSGTLVAASPAYLKEHSKGEIGTELAWSMAHERAVGPYYPKLQVEIPFTTVTGPRLLIHQNSDPRQLKPLLLQSLKDLAVKMKASSLHISYLSDDDQTYLNSSNMMMGMGSQFQWENDNYKDFQNFLSRLKGTKVNTIKRERKIALEDGLSIDLLTHERVTPEVMAAFYPLFLNTQEKYGVGETYNLAFFCSLADLMQDQLLMIMIKRHNKYIAGSMCFVGGDTLYTSLWGCTEEVKFLHFETTYYQVIDFAIKNSLRFIDAGPGGGHKTARGYLPKTVHHAHWFRSKEFGKLIRSGLEKKSAAIENEQQEACKKSPYK